MLRPERCPILATTATASDSVKKAIVSGLKLRSGYHFENLGNFRSNLCYGVHRMTGGQKSYSEVGNLFPGADTGISHQAQAIVFVNNYTDAHANVPIDHSLKSEQSKKRIAKQFRQGKARILVSTEAMTMGVDFPKVQKVVNYLVPRTEETWGQRSGRGARDEDEQCECIIMATPKMLSDALEICIEAGINISGLVSNTRLKTDGDSEHEDDMEALPEATDILDNQPRNPKSKNRYPMTVAIAEYLATKGCLVDVLDCAFNNPPHKPCYDVGGCMNCVHRRQLWYSQPT
ncbi:hypothetical protein FS749_007300 [Ceratobasidium sp. UAMH 11750]|nr:hypothetical protein FS749_007300 [Ceratobasidium sp. UAMH 11750]